MGHGAWGMGYVEMRERRLGSWGVGELGR